jgi:predicted nucleotide-binding protein
MQRSIIRHALDLTSGASTEAIEHLVHEAVRAVRNAIVRTPKKISARDAKSFASQVAAEARGHAIEKERESGRPDAAFVVHGSDHNLLGEVEAFLVAHNVKAVVLTRLRGAEQSLFQKFLKWGKAARFAIVLLSADDLGASRVQYEHEDVRERALQFRARQNVILELGFFYGRLGWENVFVLLRPPNKIFPNFERPSDLDGVLFDQADPEGDWKKLLTDRLRAAGFELADPVQPV